MRQRFDAVAVPHDLNASVQVARWAYGEAEAAHSLVWTAADDLVALPAEWQAALSAF